VPGWQFRPKTGNQLLPGFEKSRGEILDAIESEGEAVE
jgi:hypothetical protein